MHPEHADARAADIQACRHHPARFEAGDVDDVVAHDFDPATGEDRVAVPAHRIVLHVERHGDVIGVAGDHEGRQHTGAHAEPEVHLLQADDIRIDLGQHLEDARGIALAVGADAFVDVVAGDFDPLRHHPAASRLALPPAAVVSMVMTRSVANRAR